MKGTKMRKSERYFLSGGGVGRIWFAFSFPVVFTFLLMFPSVTLCASWEPIGPDGGNFIFSMTNPANADEVTAITTSPSPSYVWRSTDAGATWSKIGEIPYPYVYDVSAFDSTLYAISSSRCFRSTDGGISWSESRLPSSSGYAYQICAHPTDSRIVCAAGYKYDSSSRTESLAFFRSTDGGLSWSASSFFTFDYFHPLEMAVSVTNPSVIYVSGIKEAGSYYGGVLLTSTDGGRSWTDITSSLETENYNSFYSVAVDPTDGDKVYVGGAYFYRSVRTPRGTDLTWTRSRAPLFIYSLSVDPVNPSRIYASGYESVAASTDYGTSWNLRSNSVKSSARHIAVAPADPSRVYVSSYAGLYKSPDAGATWHPAYEGIRAARIAALAVDPSLILVQNSGYLMAYRKRRNFTWEEVVTPESCGEVCDILINPDNPDTVLILEGYG